MIVTREQAHFTVVTQSDHARFAAEVLSLWRADGLPEHPRREELLFAVREHDNGWRESDAAPRIDPESGAPRSFLDLPDEWRREIWDRGTRRYGEERPAAAALITRHALALHEDRRGDDAWGELLARLEERLDEQLEVSALDRGALESDYPWLALADTISLRACGALGPGFEQNGTHVQRRGTELTLDPFPLAGATTFAIPCRRLPTRPYASDTDLAVELASARWTSLKVRLVPAR